MKLKYFPDVFFLLLLLPFAFILYGIGALRDYFSRPSLEEDDYENEAARLRMGPGSHLD